MVERDALLRAVVAEPDDDVPRLVYADWLDEHGDESARARAEFIRLQVESARRGKRTAREEELWLAHGQAWWMELPPALNKKYWTWSKNDFHRGFVERLNCTARQFLQAAGRLAGRFPLASLNAASAEGLLERIAATPALATVRHLRFNGSGFQPAEVVALAAAPHLRCLTELSLSSSRPGAVGLSALAMSASLPALTRLHLPAIDAGPDEVGALLAGPLVGQFVELTLANNRLGDEGAARLAASCLLAGPLCLSLGLNGIGAGGARALAESPHLERVGKLELPNNPIPAAERVTLRRRFGQRVCF